ncbi:MAG: hypothetical protein ACAI44_31965 [Candidatus Sericytochromatia bacterium]
MEVSGNSNIAPTQSTQRTPPPPPPPKTEQTGGYENPAGVLRSKDSSNNSLLSWVSGVFDKLKGSVFGMAGAVVGGRGGESQE